MMLSEAMRTYISMSTWLGQLGRMLVVPFQSMSASTDLMWLCASGPRASPVEGACRPSDLCDFPLDDRHTCHIQGL